MSVGVFVSLSVRGADPGSASRSVDADTLVKRGVPFQGGEIESQGATNMAFVAANSRP